MANETLKIILDMVYKGRADAARAKDDIKGVGKASKTAEAEAREYQVRMLKLGAALGATALAAKQVYEEFKRGAELESARLRFDSLAISIGTVSDALMVDLKEATQGMVSEADLVAAAGQIMSLGLADTHEGVVRLSAVAGQLGWDMNQLTLTLANQSTMRLDSLGLSVEDVTGRVDALKDAGYAADEAFKLAVIEAGEDKIVTLGGSVSDTEKQLLQLEATATDLRDSLSALTVEGLQPVLDDLAALGAMLSGDELGAAGALVKLALWPVTLRGIVKETFAGGVTLDDAYETFTKGVVGYADSYGYLEDSITPATRASSFAIGELTDASTDLAIANLSLIGGYEDMETAGRRTTRQNERMAEANEAAAAAAAEHDEAVRLLNEQLAVQISKSGDFFSASVEIAEGADPMAVALYNAADASNASARELALLGLGLGLFDEAQATSALKAAALQGKIEELGLKIASGMGIEEALGQLRNFQFGLDNIDETGVNETADAINTKLDWVTRSRTVNITASYYFPDDPWSTDSNYEGPGATGIPSTGGGVNLVGEYGPEFVNLPAGSRVTSTNVTHNTTQNMRLNNSRSVARIVNRYLRNKSRPATVIG